MRVKCFVSLLILLFLVGCATGSQNKIVSSYELTGITLKAAYNTAKSSCDSGALPADKCAQLKKIYNDARVSYILAGDAIAVAIETDDLINRQAALEEYQKLSASVTALTRNLINLLMEFGVLKGGVK